MSELKETKKMKIIALYEQTPKQVLNPTLNPKIAHQGPQNSKTTTKLSQNQSELKETKKIKVFVLYEKTTKHFEPEPNPKNSLFFAQESQKITHKLDKIKSKN